MRHNRAMQIFSKLLPVSIAFSLLAATIGAFADGKSNAAALTERWYQIEVLVYEPIQKTTAGEAWPATSTEEQPKSLIQLAPINEIRTTSKSNLNAFQQLAPETLNLSVIAKKLANSRGYRVITLQGWQQPVKQRHEAESVHFTDKQITDTMTTNSGEVILNPPRSTLIDAIEPLTDDMGLLSEEMPAKIDGSITVSVSRYLHMALNLRYHNPNVYLAEQIALQKPEEVIIENFMMKQSRRMRSKKVHVFDHPYFGVIAVITPVERIINR